MNNEFFSEHARQLQRYSDWLSAMERGAFTYWFHDFSVFALPDTTKPYDVFRGSYGDPKRPDAIFSAFVDEMNAVTRPIREKLAADLREFLADETLKMRDRIKAGKSEVK